MQVELPRDLKWKPVPDAPFRFEDSNYFDLHDPEFEKLCDQLLAKDIKPEYSVPQGCPWIVMRKWAGTLRAYLFRAYLIDGLAVVEGCWLAECRADGKIIEEFKAVAYTIPFDHPDDLETDKEEFCKTLQDAFKSRYVLHDSAPIQILMGKYRYR